MMKVNKNGKYYLLPEMFRDKLVVIIGELWKKAVYDKYHRDDPEEQKTAARAAEYLHALKVELEYLEGGTCLEFDSE